MGRYTSELKLKEFQSALESIVTLRPNNVKTRLGQILSSKDGSDLVGTIKPNSFTVWTFDSALTGLSYPIVTGSFKEEKNGTSVRLATKMNEIGAVLTTLILSVLVYAILTEIIL